MSTSDLGANVEPVALQAADNASRRASSSGKNVEINADTYSESSDEAGWEENGFSCDLCGQAFELQTHLDLHVYNSHRSRFIKKECSECGELFLDEPVLVDHITEVHVNVRNFSCKLCAFISFAKGSLQEHVENVHGRVLLECSLCKERFAKSMLYQHIRNVHKSEKAKCLQCGKVVKDGWQLKYHIEMVHEKVKNISCNLCNFTALRTSCLLRHIRDVHDKLREECSVCQKLILKDRFEDHIRSHTGEKPHKCERCGKAFTSRRAMRDHMRYHKDTKDLLCDVCGKRFMNTSHLIKHKIVHRERTFRCKSCSKAFKAKHQLEAHLLMHTKATLFYCSFCGKGFTRKWNLKLHLRIHNKEKTST